MNTAMIIGIILTLLGGIGGIYSVVTIINETAGKGTLGFVVYDYSIPFEPHERTVIIILVAAILLIIFGIAFIANSNSNKD